MIAPPKVLIIDTSILCVYLELPGFPHCGSDADRWDVERVQAKIEDETKVGTALVLPLATIIETGNHISQIKGDRLPHAQRFAEILRYTANEDIPWTAFIDQGALWNKETLLRYAEEWPALAVQKISLGDASIVEVANFYVESEYMVEIFTGDNGLRSMSPSPPTENLRRDR